MDSAPIATLLWWPPLRLARWTGPARSAVQCFNLDSQQGKEWAENAARQRAAWRNPDAARREKLARTEEALAAIHLALKNEFGEGADALVAERAALKAEIAALNAQLRQLLGGGGLSMSGTGGPAVAAGAPGVVTITGAAKKPSPAEGAQAAAGWAMQVGEAYSGAAGSDAMLDLIARSEGTSH